VKLYHIVAFAKNRVIGKHNKLPWHFSADLKRFKKLTMGNTLIMGRKTFESIGTPLPGRANFVLSRGVRPYASTAKDEGDNLKFFSSIHRALQAATTPKVFIIGGADLFRQTMDQIDGIYLTQIDGAYDGDVFYPEIPQSFRETSRVRSDDEPKLEFVDFENTEKA